VFVGAGQAGLLGVALGDEPLADLQAARQKRWAELQARYETEKKKDPDFAVPPNENDLPIPAPRLLWQAGKDRWHIDSPITVVGDRVLAGSAYLEDEKTGERALICVKASDGTVLWKTPMHYNPWAGPSVSSQTVVVASSSIRFDPKEVAGARGEVLAVNLANGEPLWAKEVRGGIVSPVAIAGGLAIAAATDGKVRAWDLATGEPRWQYDAGNPFFAGPTVAGDLVHVADLKGVVHAIALADGELRWQLKLTGMFYGSPTVHQGRLYLASCNLEANNPTNAIFCLGHK
jgi:outer membrane protein assembly factor BamB